MTDEEWKEVPGYKGLYQASTLGRVRSMDRVVPGSRGGTQRRKGRILASPADGTGHLALGLCLRGHRSYRRVSIIVYETFIGPLKGRDRVIHKNGDKTDCRVENLELRKANG